MDAIRIDPEFQKKIPPLTDEEFTQLQENILRDGEVYEPLFLWQGIIVDGHNRWKIILEHPEIIYHTREMDFPNKWAAFEWMCKKQLGRRNLTSQQRTALIGETYLSRKNSVGGQPENTNAKKRFPQNEGIVSTRNETAEAIANELGISRATVERSAKYAQGLEALRIVSDEAADKMLRGYSGIQKQAVMSFPKMNPDDLHKVADAILAGEALPEIAPNKAHTPKVVVQAVEDPKTNEITPSAIPLEPNMPPSEANHKSPRIDPEIERINAEGRNLERVTDYTLEDMLTEMREISHDHIEQLKHVLSIRSSLLNVPGAREKIVDFIKESISSLNSLISLVAPSDHKMI